VVEEAQEMLGESVAVYLDGGPSPGSVASTILDITGPTGRVLRLGGLPLERLQEYDGRIEPVEEPTD
jgi:tRNA A37 threonylcarbamoyladenosine synthetase subunit TsaC/SUA5/YrdC